MKMPSLDDLRIFLAVACEGSLNAAAIHLSASAATLSRRINQLEKETGKSLFHRSASGYQLTADGEALRERVQVLDDVRMEVKEWLDEPRNRSVVRISAGTWTSKFLVDHISYLHKAEDHFGLIFVSTEERLNIVHREVDIGLRNSRPQEPNLAARLIGNVKYAGYAAQDLKLDENESEQWPWVLINPECAKTRSARWMIDNHLSSSAIQCSSPHTLIDLVQAGAGVTILPCFIGDRMKNLRRVSSIYEQLNEQQWLVLHNDTRHREAVRTVIDRLGTIFDNYADLYRAE